MSSKKRFILIMIILSIFFLSFSLSLFNNRKFEINNVNSPNIETSATLDGSNNLKVIEIIRNVNISGYDFLTFKDRIIFKNLNQNPIDHVYIGLPLKFSNKLLYLSITGKNSNPLSYKKLRYIIDDNELVIVYLETPILPQQEKEIIVWLNYGNVLTYTQVGSEQHINFTYNLFPLLPYKAEGDVKALIKIPKSSTQVSFDTIKNMGMPLAGGNYLYSLSQSVEINYLDPFLENLGKEKEVSIVFKDDILTRIELEKLNREIMIDPWGSIKVKEEHVIKNTGIIKLNTFSFFLPKNAMNVRVYDDLGEIQGISIIKSTDFPGKKEISITLYYNRAPISLNSKFAFYIEYNLPFDQSTTSNGFQQSILINLQTSSEQYTIKENTIKIFIKGCGNIDYISKPPVAINHYTDYTMIEYVNNQESSMFSNKIQITFTLDYFSILMRPLLITLIVAISLSIYVITVRTRKERKKVLTEERIFIPINEIREFCSLYEEINALLLEIANAEEATKRKKMARKAYKNLLDKNMAKIESIKRELLSYKKILMDAGEEFEKIVKRLDLLDAERLSINDSINLLEMRYKRGKLPSKAAYQKLYNDFVKRKRKIDRTIDKYIQHLRNYLL